MDKKNEHTNNSKVNPGYALSQMSKALKGANLKAVKRAEKWSKLYQSMLSGKLSIGSRRPVAELAPWITLEVLHGGFASGEPAAGGPLLEHELKDLKRLKVQSRLDLNLYYSKKEGIAELQQRLTAKDYELTCPEEGALLIVAWLLAQKKKAAAEKLLHLLVPYFERIRFYPQPLSYPTDNISGAHIVTVNEVVQALYNKKPKAQVEAMREALEVWQPMHHRAINLILETALEDKPFQVLPTGWEIRAKELLDDYQIARTKHKLCSKPHRPKENFFRLRQYLARQLAAPNSLSDQELKTVATILRRHQTKHGTFDSEKFNSTKRHQMKAAQAPSHAYLATKLARWLESNYRLSQGVSGLKGLLPEGLPWHLRRLALRCWQAPLQDLLEERLFSSSEAMANVLSQLTAHAHSMTISDPELRFLYRSIYLSFSRRRSLLLVNLEAQVRLDELPFIKAIDSARSHKEKTRSELEKLLKQLSFLTLSYFPQALLPNKLVQELQNLSSKALLDIPWTKELAADIFMGEFSKPFLKAAQLAAKLLEGSLYERYYDIPYKDILNLDPQTPEGAHAFSKLCWKRATLASRPASILENARVIEQAQILSTHNLATIFGALGQKDELKAKLLTMAERSFKEVCRLQRHCHQHSWHNQLIYIKNSAYAWRQQVFYLSFCSSEELERHLENAHKILKHSLNLKLAPLLMPALTGLEAIIQGSSFDDSGYTAKGRGRRLLGYTSDKHWLMLW